jgi:hypothetical protein
MAKYVSNEHGEWLELKGDTFTFWVLDSEESKKVLSDDEIDLTEHTSGGCGMEHIIMDYGREVTVRV